MYSIHHQISQPPNLYYDNANEAAGKTLNEMADIKANIELLFYSHFLINYKNMFVDF